MGAKSAATSPERVATAPTSTWCAVTPGAFDEVEEPAGAEAFEQPAPMQAATTHSAIHLSVRWRRSTLTLVVGSLCRSSRPADWGASDLRHCSGGLRVPPGSAPGAQAN